MFRTSWLVSSLSDPSQLPHLVLPRARLSLPFSVSHPSLPSPSSPSGPQLVRQDPVSPPLPLSVEHTGAHSVYVGHSIYIEFQLYTTHMYEIQFKVHTIHKAGCM